MRPECAWSMSTVGLTAQEISFPIENPFLRGSYCHSMAGSKPSWSCHHNLNNFCLSINTTHRDPSYGIQQKGPPPSSLSSERHKHSPSTQRLPPKKSPSCSAEASTASPADDQVVPSFQKLSMYKGSSPSQTLGRCSKPLPPIPARTDISPEQTMDNEVEFFTISDDSCRLVADQCPKSSPFRYGVLSRRSLRDCGQINYAYYDDPNGQQSQRQRQQHHQTHPPQEVQEQYEPQRQEQAESVVPHRQQDRRKVRRSLSGPAGCFNKPSLHIKCYKRYTHSMDKSEVPPPIPPRTNKTGDCRRWSAEVSSGAYSDEDKPPKVPPREPLSRTSSRTPSPKSLPTYINGVMPPTQSFAPDPNYVGRSLQRQNSEPPPIIIPVMENGEKTSATHYYLLPQQSASVDSPYVEKFLRIMDSPATHNTDVPESDWDCHTRRKTCGLSLKGFS